MFRRLFQLKPRDVPLRVAVRNTAAVVMPLAIGIASGHIGAGLGVAAGALNTMFSDQPGPYRLRAQRMVFAALGAGMSAFAGAMLGDHLIAFTLAALVWGIAGGMLVSLGLEAGRAGLTAMILLIVTGAEPQPLDQAIGIGLLIFSGGVLQTLFALAAWPLQRYRPERHALSHVFHQLASMARSRSDLNQAPPTTQAVQFAQELLHGAHRSRSIAVESFRVLAEVSERIRVELLAIGDLRVHLACEESKQAVNHILSIASLLLEDIADALTQGATPLRASSLSTSLDALIDDLQVLRNTAANKSDSRLLRIAYARSQGLAGQLRSATRNANFAGSRGELRALAIEARLPPALRPMNPLSILRANLNLSSVAFRHSLRCGICLALAVATERAFAVPHGYWIPMTTAIVLKPDFAGTFSFGVLRVLGTLAGLVLTSVLIHLAFDGVWDRLLLLTLLCFSFRLLTTVNYGIGIASLTGLIVILMSFQGEAPDGTMLARALNTAAGSALALIAYALWPTWEKQRLRPSLAAMIDAYRLYFETLLRSDAQARADARAVARATRTNAQASLDRYAGEPRHDAQMIALAEAVFANGNRLVRACMALEAVLMDAPDVVHDEAILGFGERVDAALRAIATSLREQRPPAFAALRPEERKLAAQLESNSDVEAEERYVAAAIAHAFDRLTDSIDTLAHVMASIPQRGLTKAHTER
jgi:uncharacterized membrane protein YccC